jgi:hypothetical protein
MIDAELEEGFRSLAEHLRKQGNRSYRRYALQRVDGRWMLVRDELDLMFENVLNEVCGTEPEPDDKDGTFLD